MRTALLNPREVASWNDLLAEAIHEPDALLSNLKVTRAHHLLSLAVRQVVGEEGGANCHSQAVQGLRKAGVTIREEGLERAFREVTFLTSGTGSLRARLPAPSLPDHGMGGRDWLEQELILAENGQGIRLQTLDQVVRAAQEVLAPCYVVLRCQRHSRWGYVPVLHPSAFHEGS